MKKFANFVGIISGIVSIVFAFIIKKMPLSLYDYTYNYAKDASVQAANNIQFLNDIVRTGLFAFLLVLGIALIGFFIAQLAETPVAEPKINEKFASSLADTADVINENQK